MPHRVTSISSVVSPAGPSSLRVYLATVAGLLSSILMMMSVSLAQTPAGDVRNVNPASLCVTEGAIEKGPADRLAVNVPKMRAYVNAWTAQSIEMRFTYLGGTSKESALGSGAIRRQFGLKLRAQDPCNLVYAMWRVDPEAKLVVSVKRNPNAHTSAECGNRGYENIKPRKSSPVPRLRPGESHTLRAEMKKEELRVFVDDHEVWAGDVGADAAALVGQVGIRSDNARLDFDLKAGQYEGMHPNYLRACRTSDSD
jgi:hypothetical protein